MIQHSSSSFDFNTPPNIVEAARKVLGRIDLDPASSDLGNTIVQASRIYTLAQNGFTKPWYRGAPEFASNVFLNPPGGKCDVDGTPATKRHPGAPYTRVTDSQPPKKLLSAQKTWWYKLVDEYCSRRVASAIFVCFSIELLQNAQVTEFSMDLPTDFPICYPRTRLAYYKNESGKLVKAVQPPHASCIIYLPPDSPSDRLTRFREVFGEIGVVVVPDYERYRIADGLQLSERKRALHRALSAAEKPDKPPHCPKCGWTAMPSGIEIAPWRCENVGCGHSFRQR